MFQRWRNHCKGVEQDPVLAFEWYMKAADKGDMQSQGLEVEKIHLSGLSAGYRLLQRTSFEVVLTWT
jgi:TPR repeat protein